jgi:sugar lactone lactonase YvrE
MTIPPVSRPLAVLAAALAVSATAAHPPAGIAVHDDGRVTWIDGGSFRLVTVAADGSAATAIPPGPAGPMRAPHHLVSGPGGRILTVDDSGGLLREVRPDGLDSWMPGGEPTSGGIGAGGDPLAVDAEGAVWWVDRDPGRTCRVVRQRPGGVMEFVAGGAVGHADGVGDAARFGDLHGGSMAWAPDGTLVVTDDRRWVRRISPDGTVRTIAGGEPGPLRDGDTDGDGDGVAAAGFGSLGGVAVTPDGTIVVVDAGHRCIRTIAPDGRVRTVGGLTIDDRGRTRPRVRFDAPEGVAVDPQGGIWVLDHADDGTRAVRLRPDGTIDRTVRFDPAAPATPPTGI